MACDLEQRVAELRAQLKASALGEYGARAIRTALQVETQTAAATSLIDGTQVRELALNGRNWVQLLMLIPGVSDAGNSDQIYSATSCGPGVTCPPNEPPGSYEVRVVYLGPGTRWYRLRVSYTW